MLRTFAAALVATTLIAGSAFAAQPSTGAAGVTPAAPASQAAPAGSVSTVKATKTVKQPVRHFAKHGRKHLARVKSGKTHAMRQAHHNKTGKTHQASATKAAKRS
jgi:hypothetical protein